MEHLCSATEELRLQMKADGSGYESVHLENAGNHIAKRRTMLIGTVKVDALMRPDEHQVSSSENSPQYAGMKRSPLDRRTTLSGRSGRGFNRTVGSPSSSRDTSTSPEPSPTYESEEGNYQSIEGEESYSPTSSPSSSRRLAGSIRPGNGMKTPAGWGRGPLPQGVLKPAMALKRQTEIRRDARSISPTPNDSN